MNTVSELDASTRAKTCCLRLFSTGHGPLLAASECDLNCPSTVSEGKGVESGMRGM